MQDALAKPNGQGKIARPLKVLVPLIQDELSAADEAALEHYRRAGEMLLEAKGQVSYGSWGRWLSKNFTLSHKQANRYMKLARCPGSSFVARDESLTRAIGESRGRSHTSWKHIPSAARKIDVQERQHRDNEMRLLQEMLQELINVGYKAMAMRLQPDRGGSKEGFQRLMNARDYLLKLCK
jgi:hypothetical protein